MLFYPYKIETERKYPPTIIQKAMREAIHYSLQTKKNAKVQALDVIKQLQKKSFPIERAKSKVKVVVADKDVRQERDSIIRRKPQIRDLVPYWTMNRRMENKGLSNRY